MRNAFISWTGLVALVGLLALAGFALPTPPWIGWPCLVVAIAAVLRLMVVGNRRYSELHAKLDLDHIDDNRSRVSELAEILKHDKPS